VHVIETESPRTVPDEQVDSLLRATGLTKRYGSLVALDGLSIDVREGEIVAILGPSGSGKSTLLLCLAGIIQPEGGHVLYRGQVLGDLSDRERTSLRRRDFGFVFQFGQLVPDLSGVENVSLPLRLGGSSRREAEGRASEWLARLDVADVADKRVGEMSGGQAQRVAVARALVTAPSVVFTDEPTGSLDSLNGELVMELLVGAASEHRAAVVLVTHEPRIAAFADREVIVRDGRVVEPRAAP
jgi:putative ABC transport system ATP-binding protein